MERKGNPTLTLKKVIKDKRRQHEGKKWSENKNNHETFKKMAIRTYISTITLIANGLNAPLKRQRVTEWLQKIGPIHFLPTRDSLQTETLKTESLVALFHFQFWVRNLIGDGFWLLYCHMLPLIYTSLTHALIGKSDWLSSKKLWCNYACSISSEEIDFLKK